MTRSMTLGTGGVDDGEDADVIVHEYGHSLQDQAVPGFGRSLAGGRDRRGLRRLPGGGDVGADHRRQPKFDACIFDWDGISYSADRLRAARRQAALDLKKAERRCVERDPLHRRGLVERAAGAAMALGNDSDGPAR